VKELFQNIKNEFVLNFFICQVLYAILKILMKLFFFLDFKKKRQKSTFGWAVISVRGICPGEK
jgi:hypothetical protein